MIERVMYTFCLQRAYALQIVRAKGSTLHTVPAGNVYYVDADARFDFIQFLDLLVAKLRAMLLESHARAH